jgi:hypothetical protein
MKNTNEKLEELRERLDEVLAKITAQRSAWTTPTPGLRPTLIKASWDEGAATINDLLRQTLI